MKTIRLMRKRFAQEESGAAAVEFAMVFPLLLFLIFLMIDIARLLLLNMALHSAANEGARAAAKTVTRSTADIVRTSTKTMPLAIAQMVNSNCDASLKCVGVTWSNSCTASSLVSVTVSESFAFLAPDAVVFSFFIRGTAGTGVADISATATALCLD
ncbi:MAG: TadE-like protein [Actinomycetota bacterium]|jgi:Flp pilus assembly protein TadG